MSTLSMPSPFPGAAVTARNRIEIVTLPGFDLGPYDALCRIEACSICAATDSHLVDGSFPWTPAPPFVLGHESAGTVMALGEKVRNFREGDRVVRPMWAPDEKRLGGYASAWGGFASWGIVRDIRAKAEDEGVKAKGPWMNALPLPPMSACDATLFVTWRDCLSCLNELEAGPGQRIAVWGSGGNGLAFVRFATLLGAKAVLVGNPARFRRAESLGAVACIDYRSEKAMEQVKESLGGGADAVIEAAGTASGLPQMLKSLAEGGKLFLFGLPGDLRYEVNLYGGPSRYSIMKKSSDEWQSHAQAVGFFQSGQIQADDFCDGELPLDRIREGFEAVAGRQAVKLTVLLPHS